MQIVSALLWLGILLAQSTEGDANAAKSWLSVGRGGAASSAQEKVEVVVLEYEDLVNGKDLTDQIASAYGKDGIGLLTVRGVPGLIEARGRLLPLAQKFATLDTQAQAKYEDVKSSYNFGWSMGKEKLEGGKPDLSKGSYYANPQYDKPVDDEALILKYPAFLGENIWPSNEDCPDFELAFKSLGQLIVDVGMLVAQQCDGYVRKTCGSYEQGKLHRIINNSLCCKARLLHYFSKDGDDAAAAAAEGSDVGDFSSWCGWHNDHGSLTGLTSAMYLDGDGMETKNQDIDAGLYIKDRKGQIIKAAFPADCLAFQIGETAQIHSGGVLQATPHAVRGSRDPSVTRETFAVFMEPNWDEMMTMPDGMNMEHAQGKEAEKHLPKGVPLLRSRWQGNEQDFGLFTEATIKSYYQ